MKPVKFLLKLVDLDEEAAALAAASAAALAAKGGTKKKWLLIINYCKCNLLHSKLMAAAKPLKAIRALKKAKVWEYAVQEVKAI